MAQVVRFDRFGGPEVLQLEEFAVADPGPAEVRVTVAAIGLNRVEAIYRSGAFGPVRFPARIGYEAAGIVDAVGAGVSRLKPGDRVAVLFGLSMEDYGTYADQILYPAERVVKLPDGVSLSDAAASWMQYGTAYALIELSAIGAGDAVVITAASSSVGVAAIQIARSQGALPIGVTRSAAKKAQLQALGAAHVVVSDEEDVAARVQALTEGNGARVIFDAIGGASLAALIPALATEGMAIVYGLLGGDTLRVPLAPLMLANQVVRGWSADWLTRTPERRARLMSYVSAGLSAGTLKPVIARRFDLGDVVEAHRYLESNAQVGKVLLLTRHAEKDD